LAGSYYVESLTNELIERASRLIAEVDAMGGSIAAIESGWMQTRIADSAYAAQQAIESGRSVVVGVNRFAESDTEGARIPLQRIDERVEREQVERLQAFRAARDAATVDARLAAVRLAAEGTENLMPHFVEAVDAGATLGEICNVLRDAFGTYRAKDIVA
ncbi:MAG: methylmalonyl-CoA mutase, partial [bacterium]|nr:methylmalonyl-CoA mutase [bacterium]